MLEMLINKNKSNMDICNFFSFIIPIFCKRQVTMSVLQLNVYAKQFSNIWIVLLHDIISANFDIICRVEISFDLKS